MRSGRLVVFLLAGLLLGGHGPLASIALAKDGGGGSSNSGSGSSGSGHGSGDDRSGHGSGDDDRYSSGKGSGGGDDRNWSHSSPGDARHAVAKGWVLPLASVLKAIKKKVQGKVLDVDLSQIGAGTWVYRILVLNREGRYQEFTVDARRSEILKMRTR